MTTAQAKNLFHLERHRNWLQIRIKGNKGVLKTKLGNTPHWKQNLEKLQQELQGVEAEITEFNNYKRLLS